MLIPGVSVTIDMSHSTFTCHQKIDCDCCETHTHTLVSEVLLEKMLPQITFPKETYKGKTNEDDFLLM